MDHDPPFSGILGGTKEIEVLQFLVAEPYGYYNISELGSILSMHRDTVSRIIGMFERYHMVEFRPGRGRSKCYRLNGRSKIVRSFDILSAALIDEKVPGADAFETTLESFLPRSGPTERLADNAGHGDGYPSFGSDLFAVARMPTVSDRTLVSASSSPWGG